MYVRACMISDFMCYFVVDSPLDRFVVYMRFTSENIIRETVVMVSATSMHALHLTVTTLRSQASSSQPDLLFEVHLAAAVLSSRM